MNRALIVSCVLLLAGATNLRAAEPASPGNATPIEWPEFRGPGGQGHSSAVDLPLTWTESENIAWKVELPGLGWSSPVIAGDRVWLTSGEVEPTVLRLLCFERQSGAMIHNLVMARPEKTERVHPKNSIASPTPILEDDRVYVHFGPYHTSCVSIAGDVLWEKRLPHHQQYGPTSSPVLFRDLLLVPCLGDDIRYLVALDKRTGEQRWKLDFEGRNSEATPLIIESAAGPQLISNLADRIVAFDPESGRELWWVRNTNFAQIPRPVFGHGLVYVCGGYFDPEVWAIRPDGEGDVTDSHIAWHMDDSAPLNPSPILVGDELYCVSDNGIASCLDAKTGRRHWRERLEGDFSASPVFAAGRIYFLNETGTTYVVKPGPDFELLATNELSGQTLASLAVAGNAIFLRTDAHLYRIEDRQ